MNGWTVAMCSSHTMQRRSLLNILDVYSSIDQVDMDLEEDD